MAKMSDYKRIDVSLIPPEQLVIRPGWNVRDETEPEVALHIRSIADGIKATGIQFIPPLTVYIDGDEVVVTDGYCRTKGALLAISEGAECPFLPCRPEERYSDEVDRTLSMKFRNSFLPLTPMQKANVIKRLLTLGLTEQQVAERAQISLSAVKDAIVLLSMPLPAKEMVTQGKVAATQAVKTVKAVGAVAATKVMQQGVERAAAEGKTRATAKHMEKPARALESTNERLDKAGKIGYNAWYISADMVPQFGWDALQDHDRKPWIAAAKAILATRK